MAECLEGKNYKTKPKNSFKSMLALFDATNEAKMRRWRKGLGDVRIVCGVSCVFQNEHDSNSTR
jgi:hypothetical protein